jgi:hypothetical protein
MNTRLTEIAPKLSKLVLLLSSDQPGEAAAAAAAIGRTLRTVGCDWHDLASVLQAGPQPQPQPQQPRAQRQRAPWDYPTADWRELCDVCLERRLLLSSRETEFIESLGEWRGNLTEKQLAWLFAIHARVKRAT